VASGRAVYNFGPAPEWAAGIEDLSGQSVFFKDDDGQICLTYASFGRGGEEFLTAYRILDVTPKGRQENGPYHSLGDWVRPRDMYGKGGMVEPNGRYHAPSCGCSATAKNLRRSDALPVLRATVRGTIRAIARTVGDDPC
jgi:hypothetical protein